MDVRMISRGVEISIAGGIAEMKDETKYSMWWPRYSPDHNDKCRSKLTYHDRVTRSNTLLEGTAPSLYL